MPRSLRAVGLHLGVLLILALPAAAQSNLSLSSISPTTVSAGSPGFTLTLTGVGFSNGTSTASRVYWIVPSTQQTVVLATTYISSTQLTAFVPANLLTTAQTVSVYVLNSPFGDGFSSNALPFAIAPASPVVNSITPNQATAGSPGITIQVSGANYNTSSRVHWIYLNQNTTLPTTFISSTQLVATVSASMLANIGTAQVNVVNSFGDGFGTTSNSALFSIIAADPIITSIDPNTANVNSPALTMRVTGANFTIGSQVRWTFNGTTSTLVTNFVDTTRLDATVPASLLASIGVAQVVVVNLVDGGQQGSASGAAQFAIVAGRPTVTTISPNTAKSGSATLTVQVNGTNFIDKNSQVNWTLNGFPTVLSAVFRSSTQLDATVPASLLATAGSAQITVSNTIGGGAVVTSNAAPFTITGTPVITAISPNTAIAGAAALNVQITGTNFTNASAARWIVNNQTTNLVTQFVSGTSLIAAVPASLLTTPASAQIFVVDGAAQSTAVGFTISAALPSDLTLAIPVPAVTPADQPAITVRLGSAAAADYSGVITLTFAPASLVAGWLASTDNAQVVFANKSKTTTFTIARGATTGTVSNGSFQLGTVAGVITATVTQINGINVTSNPPRVTQNVAAAAPVITGGSVRISTITGAIAVDVDAYSTPRDLTSATFTFLPASGAQLDGATQTLQLSSVAPAWFSSAAGQAAGGSFHLTVPFTYTGDIAALGSVSVTFTNSQGTSSAQTGTR